MKLAHIRLKMDKIGSDVLIKNVTPAEVLLLVSDHHANAGGNPVTIESQLEDDEEEQPLKALASDISRLEALLESLGQEDLAMDVRMRREGFITNQLNSLRERVARLKYLQARRKFTNAQEVDRLRQKYGKQRVNKAFPGALPQLPETFEEAIKVGPEVETPESRLFTVGDQ